MTQPRPEPHELWDGDPADVGAVVADVIRQLGRSPESSGFEWLMTVAEQAMEIGLYQLSQQVLDACRTLLPAFGGSPERAAITAHLDNMEGLLALRTGRVQDAERILRVAVEASRHAGDILSEALAQQNLAAALWLAGHLSEARECALAALDIYLHNGDNYRRSQVLVNLANYDLDEGKTGEAEARLDEADVLANAPSAASVRTSILGTRALIARARGDQELAGTIHRKVLRRAQRTGNIGQLRMATQNLGSWYAENAQPRRAASWLGRAADLAMREGNGQLAGQLLRAQAVQLFTATRFEESVSVMRTALATSDQMQDEQGGAEGRADLAAFLIGILQKRPADHQLDDANPLEEAGSLLDLSLDYFRRVGDAAWIERVLSNSASLALTRGQPLQALDQLVAARDSLTPGDITRRVSIDRRAASVAVTDARRPELAATFIRHAARETASATVPSTLLITGVPAGVSMRSGATAGAWELALGAAQLRQYPFALQQAVELSREASELAREDDALFFHINNDLGIIHDQAGDAESAIECFELCLNIARRLNDRVMRQQALANRAELARRQGEPQAVEQLQEAVRIAADLGDAPAQAAALMNLATAYVDDARLDEAEDIVLQADQLLEQTEIPSDAPARLTAIRGNIAVARDDFETARSFYLSAADLSVGTERIESMAAALWTLARNRQRAQYRRLLQRLIRVGQRDKLHGAVAAALLPSAQEWLSAGVSFLSAETYAAAIEMAFMQWVNSIPVTAENTTEPAELSQATDVEMPITLIAPVVQVIDRMTSALASAPSLRPEVKLKVVGRLRHDLPERAHEIVTTWIEESETLLAANESPPEDVC